jgi:adenylosuccinate synthase
MSDTSSTNRYSALPLLARRYLERLSALVETDISVISTGPDRSETIMPEENSKLRKLLLTA